MLDAGYFLLKILYRLGWRWGLGLKCVEMGTNVIGIGGDRDAINFILIFSINLLFSTDFVCLLQRMARRV